MRDELAHGTSRLDRIIVSWRAVSKYLRRIPTEEAVGGPGKLIVLEARLIR
jgi:hypothetical protein